MIKTINITSTILGILSFLVYYTTFYTTLYIDTYFSFWYFPGACLFFVSITVAIIGIFKANKLINLFFALLSFYYLLHFSSLFLLV